MLPRAYRVVMRREVGNADLARGWAAGRDVTACRHCRHDEDLAQVVLPANLLCVVGADGVMSGANHARWRRKTGEI